MEVEVIHIGNHELTDKEASFICTKLEELYKQGYWIEQKVFLDKAGTILVLVKEE